MIRALVLFALLPMASKSPCALHGRVKVVAAFADYRVAVRHGNATMRVKWVSSFPDRAGEWQRVGEFADFSVTFVTDGTEDFSIDETSSFPGCSQ